MLHSGLTGVCPGGFSPYEVLYNARAISLPSAIREHVTQPLDLASHKEATTYLLQRTNLRPCTT